MNKLFIWLRVEPTGYRLWWFFAKIIALIFSLDFLIGTLLNAFDVPLRDETTLLPIFREAPLTFLFIILPSSAFMEEIFFRLPLAIFIRKNTHPTFVLAVAVLLSAIFGCAHGGWWQIPLQGVTGFIFCIVFLKCGGFQEKYGKAILSSTCVHLTSNWIAFVLMLLGL